MSDQPPLIIERTLQASADKVWTALTDIEQLKQWLPFFPDFKAEVGFTTEFDLGPDEAHQYRHVVEVLAVVPGQKLTYSWDYGGQSPGSSVTFELMPDGQQTKLRLTAEFATIPSDPPDFLSNAQEGWTYTADGLQTFVKSNT